jgi:hypothetical protein
MTAPGFFFPGNRCPRPPAYPWKTTLLCVAATVPGAMAQSVLAPPPAAPPLVPPAVEEYQTNQAVQMQVFSPSAAAPPQQESQPFKYGPVVIRPQISYQFLYGSGIDSAPGQSQNTIVQQFSPGVLFNIGAHWTLDYTPTLTFYSSSFFRNTVDHNVQLQWGTAFHNWFVAASQSYARTADPEVQTAGQTDQQAYSTALNATYQFNDKLSADLGFSQNLNYVGNGQTSTNLLLALGNSQSWSTTDGLNDQFWPRFNAGISVGFGYNQQVGSPDFYDEQYQVSLNWRATDKVSFSVNGGLEDLEYSGGIGTNSAASDILTPIFGGTIQYQPFAQTRISVSANRGITPADFADEVIEGTSVTGDFNQRLFGHLTLDLNGGYTTSSYDATVVGLSTGRKDNYYVFNARLTCPFLRRGTFSVFYQYSNNSSSQTGFAVGASAFSYSSSQVGFDISYSY